MERILCVFLLYLAAVPRLAAQPPDTVWTRVHDLSEYYEFPNSVDVREDGGFVCTGSAFVGESYHYLFGFTNMGDLLWTRPGLYGREILQMGDGGWLIAGDYFADRFSTLVRTDNSGDTLWTRYYGGPGGWDVDTSAAGELFALSALPEWAEQYVVVRATAGGDAIWTRFVDVALTAVGGLVPLADSGCAIAVLARQPSPPNWGFPRVYRLNAASGTAWTYTHPQGDFDTITDILITAQGELVFSASRWRPDGYHPFLFLISSAGDLVNEIDLGAYGHVSEIADINGTGYSLLADDRLLRVSIAGDVLWTQNLTGVDFRDVAIADTGFLVVGKIDADSPETDSSDFFLIRLDRERPLVVDSLLLALDPGQVTVTVVTRWEHESGTLELLRALVPEGPFEAIHSTAASGEAPEGNEYVFVDEDVLPGMMYCYAIAATNMHGRRWEYPGAAVCAVMSGSVTDPAAPRSFTMSVHPNPFNTRASIRFTLSRAVDVSIVLIDINGRTARQIVRGMHAPGDRVAVLDAGGLSSGVYFVSMRSGQSVSTQKVLLLK